MNSIYILVEIPIELPPLLPVRHRNKKSEFAVAAPNRYTYTLMMAKLPGITIAAPIPKTICEAINVSMDWEKPEKTAPIMNTTIPTQ